MTWFLAYLVIWLLMSVVVAEMHRIGKHPLPVLTCVIAGSFWPLSMMALVAVLVWWTARTVGKWFRTH